MATFVTLLRWTDQGIRNVRDTAKRAANFRTMVAKAGGSVKDIYWTVGQYDVVATFDAPDDETATALMLGIGSLGNVRSETLRAFSEDEMKRIVSKLPS
jgi:uncharacterized protein with GYD domain